jgi:hypothetical protein
VVLYQHALQFGQRCLGTGVDGSVVLGAHRVPPVRSTTASTNVRERRSVRFASVWVTTSSARYRAS